MQVRLRLDLPALEDPIVKDALAEAEMFVGSFNNMGGFLLLSPFDMIRLFTTVAEIMTQSYILWSMSLSSARAFKTSQHWTELMILSFAAFPTLFSFLNSFIAHPADRWFHSLPDAEGTKLEEQHVRMRNLAYGEKYRPEVLLFGMGEWILKSWADAKRTLAIRPTSVLDDASTAANTFARATSLEFFGLVRTVCFVTQIPFQN